MNKTININLGGLFFHIDESAYKKLKYYLDAIASSLSDDPQGKDEIITDIEARISELLSDRITDIRQVVNDNDIEVIITIMGQPEDYSDFEQEYDNNSSSKNSNRRTSKKLFRDGNDKFLGGVCSGLGHYIGIDTIWIRLAFIILIASGFSPLVYILLWVLLPEAKTTSEKLQMEGEPVNIDNIEKKIRNEFENISSKLKDGANEFSDKISSADYEKLKYKTKSGIQDFLDTLGKILQSLFNVFGKLIGFFLILFSGAMLIAFLFAIFSIGSLEILNLDSDYVHYPPFFYDSLIPEWLLTIFLFILVGVPFIALFMLGLRILSPNIKKFSTSLRLTLLGIWLIALFCIGFSAIEFQASKAYNGINIKKHNISYNAENPLIIRVKNNDDIYYHENLRHKNKAIYINFNNVDSKYSNNVIIDVKKSEINKAYIKVKKISKGRKRDHANKNASSIKYSFNSSNNIITFNSFFLNEYKNMYKDEKVKITIYLPLRSTIYFEKSSEAFIKEIKNMWPDDMINHLFIMTPNGLQCNDCNDLEKY